MSGEGIASGAIAQDLEQMLAQRRAGRGDLYLERIYANVVAHLIADLGPVTTIPAGRA